MSASSSWCLIILSWEANVHESQSTTVKVWGAKSALRRLCKIQDLILLFIISSIWSVSLQLFVDLLLFIFSICLSLLPIISICVIIYFKYVYCSYCFITLVNCWYIYPTLMTEHHFKWVRYFFFFFLILNEYQRDSHQTISTMPFWNLPARFPPYNYIIVEINLSSNLPRNAIESNISTFHRR